MEKQLIMLLASLLGLAGCSQSSVSEMSVDERLFKSYQCESAQEFDVAYIPDSEIAVLRVVGKEYALIQVRAGSGTRYILNDGTSDVDNPVTLWTKGDDARLEVNHKTYKNCKIQ